MIKKAIGAGILAGLVMFALLQAWENHSSTNPAASSKASTDTEIGSEAPDITLTNLEGKEVSLSDYRGKKVMLNFWATWCPPCKAEMPAMQQIYSEKEDDFEILAVNLDPQNDVAGFVKEKGITFPILLDKSGATQSSYTIISIPTTFLIDEKGIIQKKSVGSMTYEQLKELIN